MDFWERVKKSVLVADGALGTMFYQKGVPKGHCYDELSISQPDLVKEIHTAYITAGAELIETNTFGANGYILGKYYDFGGKTREINYQGAKIACQAAKNKVLVAGSVGPITRPLETTERLKLTEIHELFKEQIEALADGGVNAIILETMASLEELIEGFKATREVPD